MAYNLSPESYESIIQIQDARIEAMQKRIDVLDTMTNPVLNAELATQEFIFNRLFRWKTRNTSNGLRSVLFALR